MGENQPTRVCKKKKTWVKKTIVNNEFMSLKKDYVKCYFETSKEKFSVKSATIHR